VFSEVFNRQLGGGHTHLFTRSSLERFFAASRVVFWYGFYGFIPVNNGNAGKITEEKKSCRLQKIFQYLLMVSRQLSTQLPPDFQLASVFL
jgi:hypothetical protein